MRDLWRRREILELSARLDGLEAMSPRGSFQKLSESVKAWRSRTGAGIVAEYKRASPRGIVDLETGLGDYYNQLKDLVAGFSVIVEKEFFMGSPERIVELRRLGWRGPVLAKGFVFYREQLNLYSALGANSVLLIAAALDDCELKDLYQYSEALGLEPVVEISRWDDVQRLFKIISPKIVGVNARDLETLEVDLGRMVRVVEALRKEYPSTLVIAESGATSIEDVIVAIEAGADAYLIGTELMRNPLRRSFIEKIYSSLGKIPDAGCRVDPRSGKPQQKASPFSTERGSEDPVGTLS